MKAPKWTRVFASAAAVATLLLWIVSRGKWSDPLIDSGREWIVPDALSRGALLYRDVVYWFGPLTPYFHAAFFRLFGSSFSTLVAAGIVASVGVLAALFFALRRVTGQCEAALWTALAIPTLVFMPNAGGSILGMGYRIWHAAAFALAAVTVVSVSPGNRSRWRLFAAGALAAFAGLCRTEWGIATLLAVSIGLLWQGRITRRVLAGQLWIFFGFLLVFGVPLAGFVAVAGFDAVVRDGPVLLMNLPEETRMRVAPASVRAWKTGIWNLLYGAGLWLGIFFLIEIFALRRTDPGRGRRRLPWLAGLLLLFALSAAWGGLGGALVFAGAPLISLASCFAGLRAGPGTRSAALVGFGALGLLLSYRRIFFIGDGPYVAPPLLFAFICAAGLLPLAVEREQSLRSREAISSGLVAGLSLLVILAFAVRVFQYAADERVPIAGTGGLLSSRPEFARGLEELARVIRRETRPGDGLVVFPEGEVLNFLSGRSNPMRHKLYLPGYLNRRNEAEVLTELERARPGAVVVLARPLGEYGAGFFGRDYGTRIRGWIEANYTIHPLPGARGRRGFLALRQEARRVSP